MPEIDILLCGKGPSFSTFPWDKLLEVVTVVALNETVLCIPQAPGIAGIIGIVQDQDPARRIAEAWTADPRVGQVWLSDLCDESLLRREPFRPGTKFRTCDVPKASTACVALWLIRQWHAWPAERAVKIGCIGFDAYFGRGAGPVYAKAVQDAVKEPITRSPDYSAVNAQITRWARETNCRLIDLGAEVPQALHL